MSGEIEVNEPVRVYDTSGPWGNPDFHGDVTRGLPPLRSRWIRDRGDVEECEGRKVQPIDDGWHAEWHAAHAHRKLPTANVQRSTSKSEGGNGEDNNSTFDVRRSAFGISRKPLRGSAGHPVTQLWYARQGIITSEMEFIAIRENGAQTSGLWGQQASSLRSEANRRDARSPHRQDAYAPNDLRHSHPGNSFGANI